jgi:hypothetical protein
VTPNGKSLRRFRHSGLTPEWPPNLARNGLLRGDSGSQDGPGAGLPATFDAEVKPLGDRGVLLPLAARSTIFARTQSGTVPDDACYLA